MKASEIRDLSTDAIRNRLNDSREELMRLRFQQATGELTDHSRMRQIRRRIARLLTILNEREQAPRMEGE
jgi:large subunit ribosomal protein L29